MKTQEGQMIIGADEIMHQIVSAMKSGLQQLTAPANMTDEDGNVTDGKSALLYVPIDGKTETFIVYSTGDEIGIFDVHKKMVQWIFKKSESGGWSGLRPIKRDTLTVSVGDMYEHLLAPLRKHLV